MFPPKPFMAIERKNSFHIIIIPNIDYCTVPSRSAIMASLSSPPGDQTYLSNEDILKRIEDSVQDTKRVVTVIQEQVALSGKTMEEHRKMIREQVAEVQAIKKEITRTKDVSSISIINQQGVALQKANSDLDRLRDWKSRMESAVFQMADLAKRMNVHGNESWKKTVKELENLLKEEI